jgi:hypothetical protein
MDDAALAGWGWRIAMCLGVAIVPIGLALRRTLPETMDADVSAEPAPRLATYRGVALFAFLTMLSGTIATYVLGYMTTYAKTVLLLPSGVSFGATVAVGLAYTFGSIAAGIGSDRFGRRPLMIWPMAIATVLIMPGFWLLSHLSGPATLYSVSFALRFLLSMATATAFITVTESFPPRVRRCNRSRLCRRDVGVRRLDPIRRRLADRRNWRPTGPGLVHAGCRVARPLRNESRPRDCADLCGGEAWRAGRRPRGGSRDRLKAEGIKEEERRGPADNGVAIAPVPDGWRGAPGPRPLRR